jgi:hypothetical protein
VGLFVKGGYVFSALIWKDILGRPSGVTSATTLHPTPRFDRAPRIIPHGNHRNYISNETKRKTG